METQKPVAAEQKPTTSGVPKGGWWFVAIFAVLVFIGFGTLVGYMAVHAVTSDVTDSENKIEWDHLVFLFTSVEAIVFAAGAFIFGREINRSSANASEQRANDADDKKTAAEIERAKAEEKLKKQLEGEKNKNEKLNRQLEKLEEEVAANKPDMQTTVTARISTLRSFID